MTKKEIVVTIAENTGIDRESVLAVIEEFMREVTFSLSSGENIYLRFFGTFKAKKRAAKPARNIKKNTTIFLPERYVPHFKPSDYFKNKVIDGMKKIEGGRGG
ncbi:MAG: integration host factor subunit beta [Candidatus Azobacteroides pseudotrichonymphae]|jgi:DNA-binding protein HU-beta|uniref:DNA-binding protein HU n=1 Tax=Azobacteroides pseudotrichonymphae genomovar. CFP2 TaxID=511995 RepID=B6YQX6_AZOPC|nr:HU family DNA-binding protein [Candidatus Azobacteroides pseudotrichonymphae]MDR0530003.1 integration host factor subunit beta [Bacteroidales bacterium OttesenSCG-928-I14]BAG83598.1 DNA-binding protein HU [Candidatus Azobacteroides pseudotrichonymphae genomovar. CFP2]GMO32412.1 MAG: integration host factor subunit beta [Candidatus Azobacteroides pseudotrichonymphae]